MEHIERAGVHSGDSIAVYPAHRPHAARGRHDRRLHARASAAALGVRGLMNIQYVIMRRTTDRGESPSIYVLEVNPRASRTVPFLSKVTGVPMVQLAVQVHARPDAAGAGLRARARGRRRTSSPSRRRSSRCRSSIGVDTHLGPEMKSTGEVMGIDHDLRGGAGQGADRRGHVTDRRPRRPPQHRRPGQARGAAARTRAATAGFRLYATEGTAAMIGAMGIPVEMTTKRLDQGHPNVVDVIREGMVDAVINIARRPPHRDASRRLPHPPRRRRKAHPLPHIDRYGAGGSKRRGVGRRGVHDPAASGLSGSPQDCGSGPQP